MKFFSVTDFKKGESKLMSGSIHKTEPVYNFQVKESSVLLHNYPVEVCIEGDTYQGVGEVRLDLLPRAAIVFYVYLDNVPNYIILSAGLDPKSISSFYVNGRHIDGFLVKSSRMIDNQYMIKWCPKFEPVIGVGDESTQITKVIFHLYNFVDFIGTRSSIEENATTQFRIEHIDLIDDEWKIEIKSLSYTGENIKLLNEEGGYRLTHVGAIERIDGTNISGKDACEVLNAIRFFFSFAKGCWCEPICAVGLSLVGDSIWESWSSPREPWCKPRSWFDSHNSKQLTSLFPGFMKLWRDEYWNDAIRKCIYWYLNANYSPRGIDAGIILNQTAIERLSYEFVVKEKRFITAKGFKDLKASDKMRLLFSSLEIPIIIPPETPELQNIASSNQLNWLDSPHALTEIRNSLIHPEMKNKKQFRDVYYDAWNLGLWYLEMGILAILGYKSTYGNRLKQKWVGEVEKVPWES